MKNFSPNFLAAKERISEQKTYTDIEVNLLIAAQVKEGVSVLTTDLALDEETKKENFRTALAMFKDQANDNQFVCPINLEDRFTGLHITRDGDAKFHVTYVDPKGTTERAKGPVESIASFVSNAIFRERNNEDVFGDNLKPAHSSIPQYIVDAIKSELGISPANITITTNRLQHSDYSNIPELRTVTNNHDGAYTTAVLLALANGDMEVKENRLWENGVPVKDLSREQSESIGKKLRNRHAKTLQQIENIINNVEPVDEPDQESEEISDSAFNHGSKSLSENIGAIVEGISQLKLSLPSFEQGFTSYLVLSGIAIEHGRNLQGRGEPTQSPVFAPQPPTFLPTLETAKPSNSPSQNPTISPTDSTNPPSSAPTNNLNPTQSFFPTNAATTFSPSVPINPTHQAPNNNTKITAEEVLDTSAFAGGAATTFVTNAALATNAVEVVLNSLGLIMPGVVAGATVPLGLGAVGAAAGYGWAKFSDHRSASNKNETRRLETELEPEADQNSEWSTEETDIYLLGSAGFIYGTGMVSYNLVSNYCKPSNVISLLPFLILALRDNSSNDDNRFEPLRDRLSNINRPTRELDKAGKRLNSRFNSALNSVLKKLALRHNNNEELETDDLQRIEGAIRDGRLEQVRDLILSNNDFTDDVTVVNDRFEKLLRSNVLGNYAYTIRLPIDSLEYRLLNNARELLLGNRQAPTIPADDITVHDLDESSHDLEAALNTPQPNAGSYQTQSNQPLQIQEIELGSMSDLSSPTTRILEVTSPLFQTIQRTDTGVQTEDPNIVNTENSEESSPSPPVRPVRRVIQRSRTYASISRTNSNDPQLSAYSNFASPAPDNSNNTSDSDSTTSSMFSPEIRLRNIAQVSSLLDGRLDSRQSSSRRAIRNDDEEPSPNIGEIVDEIFANRPNPTISSSSQRITRLAQPDNQRDK